MLQSHGTPPTRPLRHPHRPADAGQQRVRLERGRGRPRSRSSTPSSMPASTPSTPPTAIRAGRPGHKGGELEIVIGNWLKQSGKRDKVVIATKVGSDMGEGKHGPQGLHPARLRGLVAAPADRLHRSLPDPFRRRSDAGRGDAGGLRAAHRAGQSARDRRLQPDAGAADGFARGQQAARHPALRMPAAALQSLRPPEFRERLRADLRARAGSASSPIIRSPPASSPASTARRPTRPTTRRAAAA